LIEKHAVKLAAPIVIEEVELPELIPKQALVDNMLLENPKYGKSLALKKRLWVGEEAAFKDRDLQEYFKLYN